ncbi:hypothetical protein PAMP_006183 [Pampus punctatissimus]
MKKVRVSKGANSSIPEECCALCRLSDDDPAMFGEKVTLKQHKLSVHYLCLTCYGCKKKGACVGCNVRSCRKMIHFPCGRKQKFISQFTGLFPSDFSLPQSCSICLDSIDPILSYSILKCPSCHNSWFHRDCVQRQAHSAGLFFFRCTLCNNKENFQEEMLRMGIFIPERDASWELEANAFSELLEVYRRCDASICLCDNGRTYSAKTGPSLPVASGSPEELLQALAPQLRPPGVQVEVNGDQALSAGLDLVRRSNFDPTDSLSVRFKDDQQTQFPSSLWDCNTARQYFLKLLVQQIQDSVVFEGPDGSKNLALDSQALREDLYFDMGCLLALSLVHGGPPVGFFSRALYQCLFNYPPNSPLTVTHMTPDTHFTRQVSRIAEAKSLDDLKKAVAASWEFLELAGCNRPISSLDERETLVEDLVSFTMITRMQLPLQRIREGLQTLGVFDQVQLFPSVFCGVFCEAAVRLTAQTVGQLFTINFSQQEDRLNRETPVISFWRHFLLESEVGRSSISLQDLLCFATGAEELPAAGFLPPPSISFLHPINSPPGVEEDGGGEKETGRPGMEELRDEGLFPQSEPSSKHLLLPVTSSYKAFKSSMEQAISHHVHLLPTGR